MENNNSSKEQSIDPEVCAKKVEGRFRYSELHHYLPPKLFQKALRRPTRMPCGKGASSLLLRDQIFYVGFS